MRRTIVCLLTLVAIVTLASTVRAQVFRGVVLDRESNKPVLVAAVMLVDYSYKVRAVGMTDSAGRYELVAPGPGTYMVRVDPRGYRHEYSGGYIVDASDTVEVDLLVSFDRGLPNVTEPGRVALPRVCVPPSSQAVETTPKVCDGRWAVEVYNCFDQPIIVYYSSEGEMIFLGGVSAREYAVLHPRGSAKPLVSVRPQEDRTGFRDRSRGLIAVRVYCDPYRPSWPG